MTQSTPHPGNAAQAAHWNGAWGRHWTDRQEAQDVVLAPVSRILMQEMRAAPGERILDIGCGCGATSLDLLGQVGPGGHVLGVDISAPMLARASERAAGAANVAFIAADATTHAFEPGWANALCSRFGVMFFADPVLSFANMRKGMASGGRVAFACWREPAVNPWLMLPLQAALEHAPRPAATGPEDPGPFAFAQEARVRRILGEAGFADIGLQPFDVELDIAVGGGLDAAVTGALEIGPASRALEDQPEAVRKAAAGAIRTALAPYLRDGRVPLGGAIWIVSALNP